METTSNNAAAMREALETARRNIQVARRYIAGQSIENASLMAAVEAIDAALSALPRNCDTPYKDRAEMYDAFKDWCKAKGHTMEPMLAYDAFDWLLAPAGERKGEVQ